MEGWYCPAGSVSPYERACGDTSVYCPAASAAPTPVSPGYYTAAARFGNVTAYADMPEGENHMGLRHTAQTLCEPGNYCLSDGVRYQCPPGRYGSTPGLTVSSCSGPCLPGYYCGWGSTVPDRAQCGGADVFCKEGAALPQTVQPGYYSIDGEGARDDYYGTLATRSWERMCEPGYYCNDGIKRMCLPGYYGGLWRETRNTCEGGCAEGYVFCSIGHLAYLLLHSCILRHEQTALV